MTLFLTRYFLNEFSVWIWFTPLVFSPLLLFMFGGKMFSSIFFMILFSCALVFSKYRGVQTHYTHVLSLAPISKKTIVHVNFLLLSRIAFWYICISLVTGTLLYALIHKTFLFLTLRELLFLIGCCLLLITLNSWQFKISTTNNLLILNFFIVAIFTSLDLPQLADQFGFILISIAFLLLSITFFALRRL